jgi:hypothetical protein
MKYFEMLDKKDEQSFHLMYLPGYMSQKPIENRESIPRFNQSSLSNFNILLENITMMSLLVIEIILLIYLSNRTFLKLDPR